MHSPTEPVTRLGGRLCGPGLLLAERSPYDGSRAITETLAGNDLDAIMAATNGPAWVTTLGEGDGFSVGSSSPAAASGFPSITVPAGFSGPLPVGVSFIGTRFGEAGLVKLAFAFEKGTRVRQPPRFIPTIGR